MVVFQVSMANGSSYFTKVNSVLEATAYELVHRTILETKKVGIWEYVAQFR